MVYCLQEINGITAALAEELFHKGKKLAGINRGVFFSVFMHSHAFGVLPADSERADLPYPTLILFLPLLFVFFLLLAL